MCEMWLWLLFRPILLLQDAHIENIVVHTVPIQDITPTPLVTEAQPLINADRSLIECVDAQLKAVQAEPIEAA
jgi:hypothetical protein